MKPTREESWANTLTDLNRREKNRASAKAYRERKAAGVPAPKRNPGPKPSATIREAVLEIERTELLKAADRTNELLEAILITLRGSRRR